MSDVNLTTVMNRVATWNSLRYKREYDQPLALKLLKEEVLEYHEAENRVDQLDALCDTVYVAMGVLWKINVDLAVVKHNEEEAHRVVSELLEIYMFEPICFVSTVLAQYEHYDDYPVALAMQIIIVLCLIQMRGLGLTNAECIQSLLVVCYSNDSKKVEKVAPSVKANIDKGKGFVPPEPALTAILDKVGERVNDK